MFKKIGLTVCVLAIGFSAVTVLTAARKDDNKKNPPIEEKMNELAASAQSWNTLSAQEKTQAVSLIIDLYRVRENGTPTKSVDFYVKKIDESLAKDPTMSTLGLPVIVKLLAVMEYDYYNGQDKDQLAKQLLGPTIYEENKKRRAREAGAPGIF